MPKPHTAAPGRNRAGHWFGGVTAAIVSALLVLVGTVAPSRGATWELGPYQFVNGPSSPPLLSRMGPGSLESYGFVGKVGGVAFAGVAVPGKALASKSVTLVYDDGKPDGRRLAVRIGDSVYVQDLPDWLLVPIANYADSDYNACVSLFGERTTDASYDIVYHPAFQNTLLGLRLLQADILLFDIANTWRLPAFEGKVVLGRGESRPDGPAWTSANKITSVLRTAPFQSWVLTDQEAPVVFTATGEGKLDITGEPYYYFWISDFAAYKRSWERLVAQTKPLRAAGKTREYNEVARRINTLAPEVTEVKRLTSGLKSIRGDLRNLNPRVYDAATSTVRYAAFFRYVKRTNRQGWTAFLMKVKALRPLPDIVTPTSWSRRH